MKKPELDLTIRPQQLRPIVDDVEEELHLLSGTLDNIFLELERERTRNGILSKRILTSEQTENENKQLIENQKEKIKTLEARVKYLEKKQADSQENIKFNKEITNIVKNKKNTDQLNRLNTKLDEYIEHIEDTIKLLKTL